MTYWVERKLEFRTRGPRWEIEGLGYETQSEAEARAELGRALLEQDKQQGIVPRSKNGGVITEYRVRLS